MIVAVPAFFAVTLPELLTVATFLLDVVHFGFFFVFLSLSFTVFPGSSTTFFLLIEIFLAGAAYVCVVVMFGGRDMQLVQSKINRAARNLFVFFMSSLLFFRYLAHSNSVREIRSLVHFLLRGGFGMQILLWEARTARRFTLLQLAKRSGIGKSTLNNIENGRVSPTLLQLETIAIVLGIRITDMFESEYK